MIKREMGYIAKPAVPMFLLMVLTVMLLVAVPDLATFRPKTIKPGPGG